MESADLILLKYSRPATDLTVYILGILKWDSFYSETYRNFLFFFFFFNTWTVPNSFRLPTSNNIRNLNPLKTELREVVANFWTINDPSGLQSLKKLLFKTPSLFPTVFISQSLRCNSDSQQYSKLF